MFFHVMLFLTIGIIAAVAGIFYQRLPQEVVTIAIATMNLCAGFIIFGCTKRRERWAAFWYALSVSLVQAVAFGAGYTFVGGTLVPAQPLFLVFFVAAIAVLMGLYIAFCRSSQETEEIPE